MNLFLVLANVLTAIGFFVHTFAGDKDMRFIEPNADPDPDYKKREQWTLARGGWHIVSVDLLFASLLLGLINFSDHLEAERQVLQVLAFYFLAYAIAWLIAVAISKSFPKNYLKLGQWLLLLCIAVLIYLGSD